MKCKQARKIHTSVGTIIILIQLWAKLWACNMFQESISIPYFVVSETILSNLCWWQRVCIPIIVGTNMCAEGRERLRLFRSTHVRQLPLFLIHWRIIYCELMQLLRCWSSYTALITLCEAPFLSFPSLPSPSLCTVSLFCFCYSESQLLLHANWFTYPSWIISVTSVLLCYSKVKLQDTSLIINPIRNYL